MRIFVIATILPLMCAGMSRRCSARWSMASSCRAHRLHAMILTDFFFGEYTTRLAESAWRTDPGLAPGIQVGPL